MIHLACVIEDAIDAGLKEYNFLAGTNQLKERWSSDVRWLADVEAANTTPRGRLYNVARQSRRVARSYLTPEAPVRLAPDYINLRG
jgi:CelD/BcsL family acetyltransferase involved in cellulose biosynthesis